MRRLAAVVCLVLVGGACEEREDAGASATDPSPASMATASDTLDDSSELTGIPWQLLSGEVDDSAIPLVEGYPITLTLFEAELGGRAACNEYFVTMSRSGSTVDLAPEWHSTAMGCSPESVMESEATYLGAILRVDTLEGSQDRLSLTGDGVELVFGALPPAKVADLTGSVWVLTRLVDGDSVSDAAGDRGTLEFYTDGSMLGSTGCRSLHGSYTVEGAEVVMPEMAAEGDCPQNLMDQDSHVVTVLGDGFRASVDKGTLTLTSLGDLGLVYRDMG